MEGSSGRELSEEQLFRGYTGRLFLGISLGLCLLVFGRQLLPPLLPTIIADLSITPFQAGAAVTVLGATRAVNQYLGGRFADALSRKTVLVGSLLVLVVGFVLLSMAFAYTFFVFAVVIVGVGAGAYNVSTRTIAADLYVAKRGRAFGIQSALINIAGVGAAGGAALVLAVATWRSGFLPIAAMMLFVAVVFHFRQRGQYVVRRVELEITDTIRRLFGHEATRLVIIAIVLFTFAWQGMITFLPAFLQSERGFSPALASAGFGLIYVIGVGAAPVAGAVSDRFGKVQIAAGALLCAIGGITALLVANSTLLIGGSIVFLAIGFLSFSPVILAYLMDTFADGSMAGDLGATKSIYGVIGSLGPTYVGLIAGLWSYSVAFIGLIGCLVLSLLLVVAVEYTT